MESDPGTVTIVLLLVKSSSRIPLPVSARGVPGSATPVPRCCNSADLYNSINTIILETALLDVILGSGWSKLDTVPQKLEKYNLTCHGDAVPGY
eukprot:305528-Rhodomonas_salina.5